MAITTATQAAQLVNKTLADNGWESYQIDTTSGDTLEAGFKAIGALPPTMRSNILEAYLLVLEQHTFTSMFDESKNPTRAFWRNGLSYGGAIKEIFLKLIEAEDGYWSDANMTDEQAQAIATDLVKFKADDILQRIHPINEQFRLKLSISDLEYSKIFTPAGMEEFLNGKYANYRQSVEAKFMDLVITYLKKMVSDSKVKVLTGFDLNTANGVTSFVEQLNTVNDGMQTLTKMYNYDEVRTLSPSSEYVYLVSTPEFYNRMKSRGYSNAFNVEYYKNNNRLIMLPAGTYLGNGPSGRQVGAMLVDRRSVICALRYYDTKPFVVSNTDYRNMFTNVQCIIDYNTFFNAVAFETGEIGNFTDGDGYGIVGVYSNSPGPIMQVTVNGIEVTQLTPMSNTYNNGADNNSIIYYQVPAGAFIHLKSAYGTTTSVSADCTLNLETGESIMIARASSSVDPSLDLAFAMPAGAKLTITQGV